MRRQSEIGAARTNARVGCCGWAGSQRTYFSSFRTIEIQTTFYDPPSLNVAERWRNTAPADFNFCLKAWQLITHRSSSPTYRRLRTPFTDETKKAFGAFQNTKEVWMAWKKTLDIANTLGAAVVLFQCPSSFTAELDNIRNLRHFFQRIGPQSFQMAWEPRGTWPTELILELCEELNLVHALDPLQLNADCAGIGKVYWRLHGRGAYSYHYTDPDLYQLKYLLNQSDASSPAYIFFNNHTMKSDALRFQQLILERLPDNRGTNEWGPTFDY